MHDAISKDLIDHRIDLVLLCGYLRKFRVDDRFQGRVMNIHPSLLPEFGGKGMHGDHVHRAVLAAKKNVSGCTVHFVDQHYDNGPIILQRTVPVLPGDDEHTLAVGCSSRSALRFRRRSRCLPRVDCESRTTGSSFCSRHPHVEITQTPLHL